MEKYYKVENTNGKVWYFPQKNIRVGMMLFQPSSLKGLLLKCFLPYFRHFTCLKKLLKIQLTDSPVDDCTQSYLSNLFGESNICTSFFMGTPCKNQKITIQISNGGNILGYCKLTKSTDVRDLFENEINILRDLREKDITQIPEVIDSTFLPNGYYTFVQSTTKTQNSFSISKLSIKHIDFLNEVYNKTVQKKYYIKTDFYQYIHDLLVHKESFTIEENLLFCSLVNSVDNYYGKIVDFCVSHSDFTPWNTYFEKKKLFVFDFEYALETCPPYMDAVHFVSQVGHIQKHMSGNKLYRHIMSNLKLLSKNKRELNMLYLSYLLFVFSFYNKMFDWNFPKSDIGYTCWTEQMRIIKNQISI